MEKIRQATLPRMLSWFMMVIMLSIAGFLFGFYFSKAANAEERPSSKKKPRVIYQKNTSLDFEGMKIDGELRSPGEFYFKNRPQEKFDSLVKRRKEFHQQLMRDAVMSR